MYSETIQQFSRSLKNLSAILDKAVKHAETKKFDPNNYLQARLAPDMFAFTRQIQSACDSAKLAAARLSGKDAPKHEDNEASVAELKERLHKCAAYLDGFKGEDFQGAAERHVVLPRMKEGTYLLARDYLVGFAIPNFYFHLAMAYALLRHNGVDVGKMDFLGELPIQGR